MIADAARSSVSRACNRSRFTRIHPPDIMGCRERMPFTRRLTLAIFTLTALPAHHEQVPGRSYKMTVMQLLGDCFGRGRIEAKNVAEIASLVKTFGDGVAQQHPEVSFMVSVSVVKGSRKPNGFDAANTRNGLGQETWMKTIDKADPIRPGYPAAA